MDVEEFELPAPPSDGWSTAQMPAALLARHAPELIESVGRLLPEVGVVETVRLTGVPKEVVDLVDRLTMADAARFERDVATALARVRARELLRELRRAELRETLLLLAERAADLTLAALEARAPGAAKDAAATLKIAMDEVRADDALGQPAGSVGGSGRVDDDFRQRAEERAQRLRLA